MNTRAQANGRCGGFIVVPEIVVRWGTAVGSCRCTAVVGGAACIAVDYGGYAWTLCLSDGNGFDLDTTARIGYGHVVWTGAEVCSGG